MKMNITSRLPRRMNKTLIIRAIILTSVLWLGYSSCNWRLTGKTVFTEDRSFTMEEAMADGFELPPMQPELIGDEDYLYSLPRANQPFYNQHHGSGTCTNSLSETRVTLKDSSGHTATFRIPDAYLINSNYRSIWTRSEFKANKLPEINFLLPDFRPGCLRDRLNKTQPAELDVPTHGSYIFSGVSLDLSYYFAKNRPHNSRRLGCFLNGLHKSKGELIPGLLAFLPDLDSPEAQKGWARRLFGILLPIDPKLRERYHFCCPRKRGTNELDTYACIGHSNLALDKAGNHIRYEASIFGYMPEWQKVMEHSETFIRHWHEGE